jgi:hypothetical protein
VKEARRLFLTGEFETTPPSPRASGSSRTPSGRWRKGGGLGRAAAQGDRRAAESFADKIASDRVNLNVRHFRYWDLLVAKLGEELKTTGGWTIRAGVMPVILEGLRRAAAGQGAPITGDGGGIWRSPRPTRGT